MGVVREGKKMEIGRVEDNPHLSVDLLLVKVSSARRPFDETEDISKMLQNNIIILKLVLEAAIHQLLEMVRKSSKLQSST
jgi:hypothetical protein